MFEVRMESLLEAARKQAEIPRQLLDDEETLQRAVVVLSELSIADDTIARIRKAQTRINELSGYTFQMSHVLENVWYQYHRSEKEIMDFCEQSPAIWRRESTGFYCLDWMTEILNQE